jgi:hypothetical protein
MQHFDQLLHLSKRGVQVNIDLLFGFAQNRRAKAIECHPEADDDKHCDPEEVQVVLKEQMNWSKKLSPEAAAKGNVECG